MAKRSVSNHYEPSIYFNFILNVILPRQCKNHPDMFCYVCESFAIKSQRRKITNDLRNIYKLYFGCPLGDQDKAWAPHTICSACSNELRDWLNKRKSSMSFAITKKSLQRLLLL